MKTYYLKIFTTLIFVLTSTIGHSQSTYYVATNGSNSNLGTESNPFLTIEKAISSFGASGGTCFIKGGTYHEEINLSNQNNINIKEYKKHIFKIFVIVGSIDEKNDNETNIKRLSKTNVPSLIATNPYSK